MSDNFYRLYFDPKSTPVVFRQPQMLDNRYKFVIIGDKSVGKSAIFDRLCNGKFSEESTGSRETVHTTIEFELIADKYKAKVDLIDISDPTDLSSSQNTYFRDTSGVVLVYDVTNIQSFSSIETHLRQLKQCVPPDCDIMLLGNKIDLLSPDSESNREVSLAVADKFAESHGISLFEVSAKTDIRVRAAFEEFILKIREKGPMGEFDPDATKMPEPSDTNNNPQVARPSTFCAFSWCW